MLPERYGQRRKRLRPRAEATQPLALWTTPAIPPLQDYGRVGRLLSFYAFPAEHWRHLRTSNPIESAFAAIRLRHRRTKGCGSRNASLAMMFKLAKAAEKRWRRLNGHEAIIALIQGKSFIDGIEQAAA